MTPEDLIKHGWSWDALLQETETKMPLRWILLRNMAANPKDTKLTFSPFSKTAPGSSKLDQTRKKVIVKNISVRVTQYDLIGKRYKRMPEYYRDALKNGNSRKFDITHVLIP